VPADTPDTTPDEFTVATPVALELQAPPLVALLNDADTPGHTTELPVIAAGAGLIVITIVLEAADADEIQLAVEIILHATVLPVESELFMYVLLVATFTPFTNHWYEGAEPPFTGDGVNVTAVPGHTAPAGDAVILTDGATGANNDRFPKLVPVEPIVIPVTPVTDEAYI
jgi:hypothetical protein